jgi:hypothetical protein
MPEHHHDPLLAQYLAIQRKAFSCPGCGDGLTELLPTPQDFRISPLQRAMASLTPAESLSLGELFRPLITESHFGYVLFGSKPMALGAVVPDELKGRLNKPESRAYRSDFNVWKSLASRFPERRLQIHEFAPLSPGGASEVVIFNPEPITDVVNRRVKLFKDAFGEAVDGQGMCARLLASSSREEAFADKTGKTGRIY